MKKLSPLIVVPFIILGMIATTLTSCEKGDPQPQEETTCWECLTSKTWETLPYPSYEVEYFDKCDMTHKQKNDFAWDNTYHDTINGTPVFIRTKCDSLNTNNYGGN